MAMHHPHARVVRDEFHVGCLARREQFDVANGRDGHGVAIERDDTGLMAVDVHRVIRHARCVDEAQAYAVALLDDDVLDVRCGSAVHGEHVEA